MASPTGKIPSGKIFKEYWMQDPQFAKWLAPDPNSKYKAK